MRLSHLIVLSALVGCSSHKAALNAPVSTDAGGGGGASSCASWGSQPSDSSIIGQNLPRAMGAFVSSSCGKSGTSSTSSLSIQSLDAGAVVGTGDTLYVPVLPLFDSSPSNPSFLLPPKIVKVDATGAVNDFYVFPDSETADYASHFYSATTIDGTAGNVSRGDAVSVVADASGNIFYSNSLIDTVYRFDASGTRSVFATGLSQILSLALGTDGAIYAAIGPSYSGPSLTQAPRIVKFDGGGNATTIATLPSSYDYTTGFFGSAGQPIGLMIDLAFDAASNIYVSINMAGVVLQIPTSSGDGGFVPSPTEYATGIDAPSGVVASADGHLLVAQGPLFVQGSPGTVASNPKIIAVAPDGTKSDFFDAPGNDAYATGFYSRPNADGTYPVDAVFKLVADASGNVFYEDSLANQITLLSK